jgi:hypothetical protein
VDLISREQAICSINDSAESCVSKRLMQIADKISPMNPQYVLKRLDLAAKQYFICLAMPMDNSRHGFLESGHLYEPNRKDALIEAIDTNRVVIINDVVTDRRTQYMKVHAQNKGIQSIAIIPIMYNKEVRWLMVVDKTLPEKTFDRDEVNFLKSHKKLLEEKELSCFDNGVRSITEISSFTSLIDEFAHTLRNPLTILGPYAVKLQNANVSSAEASNKIADSIVQLAATLEAAGKNDLSADANRIADSIVRLAAQLETASKNADIVVQVAARLEFEYGSLNRMYKHFIPGDDKAQLVKVEECLNVFREDPAFVIKGEKNVMETDIIAMPNAIQTLFAEFKKCLELWLDPNEESVIEIAKDKLNVSLCFKCQSFHSFKNVGDFRLTAVQQMLDNVLNGKLVVGEGVCIISFPMS